MTSLASLERDAHVRLIDPETSRPFAFVRSESTLGEDAGASNVRGWLAAEAVSEVGVKRYDAATRFRVHVVSDDETGARYYGFEHVETGLMVQRRQRGARKYVFCTSKFGVNEQFTAELDEYREKIILTSRRQFKGQWGVRVEALESSGAETKAGVEEWDFGHSNQREQAPASNVMSHIARAIQSVRSVYTHELTHREEIIGAMSVKHKNQQLLSRVFTAWRRAMVDRVAHKMKVRRAAKFAADRMLLSRRRAFEKWRERTERTKVAKLRADDRFKKVRIRFLRDFFHSWRSRAERGKYCRLAAQRFLTKSTRQYKLLVLQHWKDVVDKEKREREKQRRADRMMLQVMNEKLYSTFYAWQDEVAKSRANDKRARQCLQRLTSRMMFKAFVAWREVVDDILAEKAKSRRAIFWFVCSTQRKAFTAWLNNVREIKRMRRVTLRLISRRENMQLYHAFQSWKELLYNKSLNDMKIEKVVRRWRQRHYRAAFLSWRDVVEHKKVVRENALKMAEKMRLNSERAALSLSFWAWMQETQVTRSQRLKEKMQDEMLQKRFKIFTTIWATRRARFAFLIWKEFTDVRIDQRTKLTWCLNRMTERIQFTAFNTWVQFVRQRKRERELMRGALIRATNRLISLSFNAWRTVTADMIEHKLHLKKVENIVSLQQRHSAKQRLRRTFGLWREHAVQMRRQRRIADKAIASMRKRELTKSFLAWKEATKVLAHQRRMVLRVMQRMQRNTLRSAFDRWLEWLDQKDAQRVILQRAVQRMSQLKLFTAFSGWLDRTQTKKRQRLLLNRSLARLSEKRLNVAFYDWMNNVATIRYQRDKINRIVSKMKNMALANAFETWKQRAMEQKVERWQMDRVLQRLTQRLMFSAFNTWFDHVQKVKRYRTVLDRFYQRNRDRSLRGCFDIWVSVVKASRERREALAVQDELRSNALAQIFGSVTRRKLGYAFFSWRDNVLELKHFKNQMARATRVLARFQKRSLSRAFNRWLLYVDERRRMMETAEMVIRRLEHRQMAYAFDGWLEVAMQRKRNRVLVSQSLRRIRYRTTVKAFFAWVEFCEEMRSSRSYERRLDNVVRSCLTKIRFKTLSLAFEGWKSRAHESKRHRALVTKSVQRMQHKIIARAFDGWLTRVNYAKRCSELINTSLQRMSRRLIFKAFNSWSDYVKQIHSFRVVERRLSNIERAVAPIHVTHSSVFDMVRVNTAMRWGLARNNRVYRNPMFRAWAQYVNRLSQHRNRTVVKMHDILADRSQRKFLRAWWQLVDVIKHYRLRTEHMKKRVVRKVFSEWKLNVRVAPRERDQFALTVERRVESTGWDFDKTYEENVRALGVGHLKSPVRSSHRSHYSTPIGSPVTIQPIVVEPDSYDRQYREIMSECRSIEAEVDAMSTVRESLQDQFDLLSRDDALRNRLAHAQTEATQLIHETRKCYSEKRFTEPFSPVKPGAWR